MQLSQLNTGDKGIIVRVSGRGEFRRRIIEMGFIKGKSVEVLLNAPMRDPIKYRIMGYEVSLRRSEAALIEVVEMSEESQIQCRQQKLMDLECDWERIANERIKTINVALVGNPNAGKTSLFNIASGGREHVGNYGGVTVDAKTGVFKHKGYTFNLVDLPGTYSLSAYSPEEIYVQRQITQGQPDVIVNVVAASNLERNLLLTTQLIDMDAQMVIALNMYDELETSGATFDYNALSTMIGSPIVPTVSRSGRGIDELFDRVIAVYEGVDPVVRHVHIDYGEVLEKAIGEIKRYLKKEDLIGKEISSRYISIRLLEQDKDAETLVQTLPNGSLIIEARDKQLAMVLQYLKDDTATALTNARYGFIDGALRETYKPGMADTLKSTRIIDSFVTHRIWGFPIFFLFIWAMFQGTFTLGEYPMAAIEWLVEKLSDLVGGHMTPGPLNDLIVNGIIGGVGGVIVFMPNIVILYLFISFMEDSGYMARAAFIMDRLMHKMGLHGKSFIPLIMGFGCNVPAIMATRTIESPNSRLLTMLINPLMSCSARLPVYMLLVGIFFKDNAGFVLFGIYGTGILLAILMARLFKRLLFRKEDMPFVMELPPYRMPTMKSMFRHMWDKASQYLRKMGGIILIASVVIWFLGYFPRHEDPVFQRENSYIATIGKTIAPVMKPLGFDWKTSVGILTGMAAKEVVVSTMGVLYDEPSGEALPTRLTVARGEDGALIFSPLVALSLMLFVLIYFPCIATIAAIKNESGRWRWALFVVFYTTALAWIVSFAVFQIGILLGWGLV